MQFATTIGNNNNSNNNEFGSETHFSESGSSLSIFIDQIVAFFGGVTSGSRGQKGKGKEERSVVDVLKKAKTIQQTKEKEKEKEKEQSSHSGSGGSGRDGDDDASPNPNPNDDDGTANIANIAADIALELSERANIALAGIMNEGQNGALKTSEMSGLGFKNSLANSNCGCGRSNCKCGADCRCGEKLVMRKIK